MLYLVIAVYLTNTKKIVFKNKEKLFLFEF